MSRVRKVRLQVGNGASASDIMLDEASHRRDHREPTVGDLLRPEGLLLRSALGHSHGVEQAATRVADVSPSALARLVIRVRVHRARVLHVLPTANLSPVHHEHLDNEKGVRVGDVAIEKGSLGPVREGTVDKGVANELRGCHARNAKHSPARVHELGLLVPLECRLVLAEVQGIETVVSRHGAVEVLGGGGAGEIVGASSGGRHGNHASAGSARGDAAASDTSLKPARTYDWMSVAAKHSIFTNHLNSQRQRAVENRALVEPGYRVAAFPREKNRAGLSLFRKENKMCSYEQETVLYTRTRTRQSAER